MGEVALVDSSTSQIMNEPSLRHRNTNAPTRTTHGRETLNSPISVANVIRMDNNNAPIPLEGGISFSPSSSIRSRGQPSHSSQTQEENPMMDLPIRNHYLTLTTSSPSFHASFEYRAYDAALLNNMSLEEISAIQNMLSSQLTNLERNIHQVRNNLGGSSVDTRAPTPPPGTVGHISSTSSKQERRPSFGARAA